MWIEQCFGLNITSGKVLIYMVLKVSSENINSRKIYVALKKVLSLNPVLQKVIIKHLKEITKRAASLHTAHRKKYRIPYNNFV